MISKSSSSDQDRRWRAGREGTPVLKVVQEESEPNKHTPRRWVGRCWMIWSVTAPGRCWPRRCGPRSPPTSTPTAGSSTSRVVGWSSATATTPTGRWPRRPARCRSVSRGSTTSASTRSPANEGGSPRRSCRRGRGSPRRGGGAALLYLHGLSSGTSCRRWSSSSARPRACPRRRSPGSPRSGKTTPRRSASGR